MKFSAAVLALSSLCRVAAGDQQQPLYEKHPYYDQAVQLMEKEPLIDTHVDLPQIFRSLARKPLEIIPQLATGLAGHIDIPRLRKGHLGGAFWTVWAPCWGLGGDADPGEDFTRPTNGLRDALEALDIIRTMIDRHADTFQYAHSAADVRAAFARGKVASLIGMEGTHFLGNSLGAMRVLAALGVRYVTLTHMCHSAFASANGNGGTDTLAPVHAGHGLTAFGRALVRELNRLGVLVDLSHTSDNTTRQAIALSRAPVVWTHSGARAVHDHQRNVPDDILRMIGDAPGAVNPGGLVHSVFYPAFLGTPYEDMNVSSVADHIAHIAGIVGKAHVGIGSDFDGMPHAAHGVDDASGYPNLVAEFLARGWTDAEVAGLMGGNLLRVLDEVDAVKAALADELPSPEIWPARTDLPAMWGGPNDVLYPVDVQAVKKTMVPVHDEL